VKIIRFDKYISKNFWHLHDKNNHKYNERNKLQTKEHTRNHASMELIVGLKSIQKEIIIHIQKIQNCNYLLAYADTLMII
jgi:hypothetical protein